MSDIIIDANKESVILTSLAKSLRSDLSYKITKNYPNVSKQLIEVQANPTGSISTPAGKEILFTLPRYGIMSNFVLESKLVTAGSNTSTIVSGTDGTLCPDIGLNIFEAIELRSHNRIICSNSDAYLRVRANSSKLNQGLNVKHKAKAFSTDGVTLASVWVDTTIHTYTPFYCSFTEDVRNYLDLNFIEQLQVRCVYNSAARMGLNDALSAATTTLWMSYYNLESDHLKELRTRNFSPEKPLVMLSYDTYVETGALASATSTTIDLKCNNAVFATHIFFRNNAAGGEALPLVIKEVTVKLGGKTLYDTVPAHVMNWENDMHGGGGLLALEGVAASTYNKVTVPTLPGPISIYWGLEPNERTFNSGAVSLHNINNPQVILTHPTASTSYDYYIVHEFWTLTSVNSADGRIEVSASI